MTTTFAPHPTVALPTMLLAGLAPDVQVMRLVAYPQGGGTYVDAVLVSPEGLPTQTWDDLVTEVKRIWRGLAATNSYEKDRKKRPALFEGYDAHTRGRICEAWDTGCYEAMILRIAFARGLTVTFLPREAWAMAKLWG